jgi:hypothetical protein
MVVVVVATVVVKTVVVMMATVTVGGRGVVLLLRLAIIPSLPSSPSLLHPYLEGGAGWQAFAQELGPIMHQLSAVLSQTGGCSSSHPCILRHHS